MVDILAIAETKLDNSFTENQFILPGYKKPFRLDVNSRSGGLLIYVNSDIPCRQLNTYQFPQNMQVVPIELNLRKQKWIVFVIYRPPKQDAIFFLNSLSDAIDFYSKTYDNLVILGDINAEPQNQIIKNFLSENSLYNHMKNKTCFKSANGKCIDLIISNRKHSLQCTGTVETGLSDHHHLIYTMVKTQYTKLPPKKIVYHNYKGF